MTEAVVHGVLISDKAMSIFEGDLKRSTRLIETSDICYRAGVVS